MTLTLTTQRLQFRPFVKSDLKDLLDLHGNPEVNQYLRPQGAWPLELIEARLERFMAHQQKYGLSKWRVSLHDNTFVGRAGFEFWGETGELELGYSLRRQCWGQGYATEAAQALLEWAFHEKEFDHLIGLVLVGNAASRRVLEKLHMRYRENRLVNTEPHDIYEITRAEFQLHKAGRP